MIDETDILVAILEELKEINKNIVELYEKISR